MTLLSFPGGRVLGKLSIESTAINTKGYETLLQLVGGWEGWGWEGCLTERVGQVENTNSDSFDLYYGLFMYNVNATEQVWGVAWGGERGRWETWKNGVTLARNLHQSANFDMCTQIFNREIFIYGTFGVLFEASGRDYPTCSPVLAAWVGVCAVK